VEYERQVAISELEMAKKELENWKLRLNDVESLFRNHNHQSTERLKILEEEKRELIEKCGALEERCREAESSGELDGGKTEDAQVSLHRELQLAKNAIKQLHNEKRKWEETVETLQETQESLRLAEYKNKALEERLERLTPGSGNSRKEDGLRMEVEELRNWKTRATIELENRSYIIEAHQKCAREKPRTPTLESSATLRSREESNTQLALDKKLASAGRPMRLIKSRSVQLPPKQTEPRRTGLRTGQCLLRDEALRYQKPKKVHKSKKKPLEQSDLRETASFGDCSRFC